MMPQTALLSAVRLAAVFSAQDSILVHEALFYFFFHQVVNALLCEIKGKIGAGALTKTANKRMLQNLI